MSTGLTPLRLPAQGRPPPAGPAPLRGPQPVRATRMPLADLVSAPGTRTVVISASRDINAKVVVLVLPPGADQPALAVKAPTTDVAARAVEREGRLLCDLARLRLRTVGRTLPRFVRVLDAGGRPAVACTALPGVPMSTTYHSWRHTARPARVQRDFAVVGSWLAGFQSDTADRPGPIALLGADLAAIEARWPGDLRVDELRSRLADSRRRLADISLPRSAVHGDLWCGNLLVHDGALTGVVDWEHGALTGEPLRDVARFALSYSLYLDRHTVSGRRVAGHRRLVAGRWGAGIGYAIDGTGWYPTLVREFVGSALDRLGAPRRITRDVLLGGLAEVAATADHPDFAEHHLELLLTLARSGRTP